MAPLIDGVRAVPLKEHRDARGSFTEIFRYSWLRDRCPVQWNLVKSEAGVIRGVHVHHTHSDYLIVVAGKVTFGLRDLRQKSPTWAVAETITTIGEKPTLLFIPRGVAHGFMFHVPSTHVYAVTHYWDLADELGCRWDDPALRIPWPPLERPFLSERDEGAASLVELLRVLELYQLNLYEPAKDWPQP